MKAFKIIYKDDTFETLLAASALELIQDRDLATREHGETRIVELSGEQAAIVFANYDD